MEASEQDTGKGTTMKTAVCPYHGSYTATLADDLCPYCLAVRPSPPVPMFVGHHYEVAGQGALELLHAGCAGILTFQTAKGSVVWAHQDFVVREVGASQVCRVCRGVGREDLDGEGTWFECEWCGGSGTEPKT